MLSFVFGDHRESLWCRKSLSEQLMLIVVLYSLKFVFYILRLNFRFKMALVYD